MNAKAILVSLLCLLVAVVSLQNAEEVDLNFLIWDFSISRILLIMITFVLGLAVGSLLSRRRSVKKRKEEPEEEAADTSTSPEETP